MSFPTDFTQSDNRSRQRPTANQRTNSYTSNYTLPDIDMSALGLATLENARCAVCDGALDPKHTDPLNHLLPELCRPCQNQAVLLKIERGSSKKEQRKRQMEALHAFTTAELAAQAEMRTALELGNRKLREEIEEIKAQIAAQEVRNGELRGREGEVRRRKEIGGGILGRLRRR
ncbi:hypothetical protein DSL72_007082 [Monilinia vaccinii-corymbosi]|uniref:Uncharacterized protein n=1 Tax=Monilinia vaccinii-corymbosi TaxID=61207 RepID=A0A8A3PLF6_9HELO|nr:hypothetical protein DSL72_007082 [Monilinia vaccinii-corymbosi]